ncbi:MAG: hypothetical protein K0Q73_1185 [Paenibacillus sp.]|jgi:hypothetical protein|nr:hypothetical protein [Paenibacillus sp.]
MQLQMKKPKLSKKNLGKTRRSTRRRARSVHKSVESNHQTNYNVGYNSGYNEGYNSGYDTAFDKGVFQGGDAIVDQLLPVNVILPSISVDSIIAAGLEHFHQQMVPVLPTVDIYELIRNALEFRKPLSIIRLGDGELLTMAQGIQSSDQLHKDGTFLNYAGVDLPDYAAKDMLLQSVMQSSIVGIPRSRFRTFLPLAISIFENYGIPYRSMALTISTINYSLYVEGFLMDLLTGQRVLLVGNTTEGLKEKLMAKGIHIVDAIFPVQGIHDVHRVMNEIYARDFDLALVSAGIPAVVIVQRIATELGKVAIDFGHLSDKISNGEAPL